MVPPSLALLLPLLVAATRAQQCSFLAGAEDQFQLEYEMGRHGSIKRADRLEARWCQYMR